MVIPLFFKSKESFGDIDIICNTTGFNRNMEEFIKTEFNPGEIFHNGNCWTFDYKEIQVDLIMSPEEHFYNHFFYMSYNDLGNFIGRLAHSLGLKYGQEGLWYNHYYKGTKLGRIIISKDYREIFNYLDLNYDRWEEGFNSLIEIFEFVGESKLFDPAMFQLKSLNKINRERNLKRKSYISFLEWIDENYEWESIAGKEADINYYKNIKEINLKQLQKDFPNCNVLMEVAEFEYNHAKKNLVNQKFNGRELMSRFGLEGKELGLAINDFKFIMEAKGLDFDNYVLQNNSENIYEDFKRWFNINYNIK